MNNKILSIALLGLAMSTLGACGGKKGPTYKSGDKVYTQRILFDTAAETVVNPSFKLEGKKKISKITMGRNELQYGYKNGILTFSGEEFKASGAGEKTINVTFKDNSSLKIEALLATRFIYDADQLQDINEELTGIYVLAQDIDCSDIDNFEPLGTMGDETDPTNSYFHGIFDGDGFAIKNATVSYSDGGYGPDAHYEGEKYPSNYDVYRGNKKFDDDHHKDGDNIGFFQTIGSSGVVRNVTFDNVKVHGRTIVGVVAANVQGTLENVLVKANCEAKMDTHYYDDDCNVGGAVGIVAGSGKVKNIVSLTSNVSILDIFQDYNDDYKGKEGNGWDHGPAEKINEPFWRFCGVNREVIGGGEQYLDSNGSKTNGVYSVIGKCWGQVSDSIGKAFTVAPMSGDSRDVFFGHTHQGTIKPSSGDADMGEIANCAVYSSDDLKKASNYASFDQEIWDIVDGKLPKMRHNVNQFEIAL